MSGNTTAIERLLEMSNKLWDAMYESGEVPTYAERAHYYLALKDAMDENDKLQEQVERLQPKDCEGNVLDIADTVNMLRSEYDGDHEWDDVVVELALTKWGGDRWIVRGSKGEAWACDCTKTGHDDAAFEASDDAVPLDDHTLIEVENAKLRELLADTLMQPRDYCQKYGIEYKSWDSANDHLNARMRKLGIEVD